MPKRYRPLQSPNPIEDQIGDADAESAPLNLKYDIPIDATSSPPNACPAANIEPSTNPVAVGGDTVAAVSPNHRSDLNSPGRNRAAFMAQHSPSRLTCNLDLSRCPIGTKVTLEAIVIAAFPASTNPDRRYVQLADGTGSVGITVWNANVAKFNRESIGRVVTCGKVVLGSHQGKKVLTMTRESTMEFVTDIRHPLHVWWKSIALDPPMRLADAVDISENTIINVAGVLGLVSCEQKMVGSIMRTLTTLHLTDPSGRLDVRSWNHSADAFLSYVEQPVILKRIRIASFAGHKIGELLDNSGSLFETEFSGKTALAQYWAD